MTLPNGQILAASPAADPASEPSMEDILASIRRIIASDQGIGAARQLSAPRASTESPPRTRQIGREQKSLTIESKAPEPVSHPGEMPGLTDLDALVFPPAAIESDAIAGEDDGRSRPEHRSHLHESLFPPASESSAAAEVFDLHPDHRVAPNATDALLSSATGASVSLSFQALTDSMLLRDPEMFERIARDALKPMLKTWLDENLPSMVERLVRAEIERVARGGRGRD